MKQICMYVVLIFFTLPVFADPPGLLEEYKLLHTDLLHIKTWGYKSFYNVESRRAENSIQPSQGSLFVTNLPTDFAIAGAGFFKIRLENNEAAYTRNGNFDIDQNGVLVTMDGYPLYDSLCLGEDFLSESLRITKDRAVYVKTVTQGNETDVEAGRLLTYEIPGNYLEHYKNAVYIIKPGVPYDEKITFANTIQQGFLESSNYHLLDVVLRMYYLLLALDETAVPNITFKRELLKLQIEKIAGAQHAVDTAIVRLETQVDDILTILRSLGASPLQEAALPGPGRIQRHMDYMDDTLYYLESIVPFIKDDY